MTQYTNSDLNTLAAAVPAPYGPLTRVGDIPDQDPNGDVAVEFTSSVSSTPVWLSRNQLASASRYLRVLEDAHSGAGINAGPALEMKRMVEVAYRRIVSFGSLPFTNEEIKEIYNILRTVPGLIATQGNISDEPRDEIVLAFTVTDAGDQHAAVVNTTTGKYDLIMWDWGDGTYSFTTSGSPANHDYVSAGSETVTAIAVGPGGVKELSKAVTIA